MVLQVNNKPEFLNSGFSFQIQAIIEKKSGALWIVR
jgi:hypothetical protein